MKALYLFGKMTGLVSRAYWADNVLQPTGFRSKDVVKMRRKKAQSVRKLTFFLVVLGAIAFFSGLTYLSSMKSSATQSQLINVDAVVIQANQAYRKGDYVTAKEYYRQAIQAGVRSTEIWTNYDRAMLLSISNQTGKAGVLTPKTIDPKSMPLKSAPPVLDEGSKKNPLQKALEWLGC